MIIDAKDLVLGRFATVAAKKALLNEEVRIVNCEEAIMTGNRAMLLAKQRQRLARGHPYHGPFVERREDRFVKRVIRGMLPYRTTRGREALKRVKCYIGVPEALKGKETRALEDAHITKTNTLKYMRLKELCKLMGKKEVT